MLSTCNWFGFWSTFGWKKYREESNSCKSNTYRHSSSIHSKQININNPTEQPQMPQNLFASRQIYDIESPYTWHQRSDFMCIYKAKANLFDLQSANKFFEGSKPAKKWYMCAPHFFALENNNRITKIQQTWQRNFNAMAYMYNTLECKLNRSEAYNTAHTIFSRGPIEPHAMRARSANCKRSHSSEMKYPNSFNVHNTYIRGC